MEGKAPVAIKRKCKKISSKEGFNSGIWSILLISSALLVAGTARVTLTDGGNSGYGVGGPQDRHVLQQDQKEGKQ